MSKFRDMESIQGIKKKVELFKNVYLVKITLIK